MHSQGYHPGSLLKCRNSIYIYTQCQSTTCQCYIVQSKSRGTSKIKPSLATLPMKLLLQKIQHRLNSPLHSTNLGTSHLTQHIIRNSILLPTVRPPDPNPHPQNRQISPPLHRKQPLPPQTLKRTNQPPMSPQTRNLRPTPPNSHLPQGRLKLIVQYHQRRGDSDWRRYFESCTRWSDQFISLR